MIENVDPNTMKEEDMRQAIITLMNLVETLSAKVNVQADEIQRLRDEIRRLKGEQIKPTFAPKKPTPLLSSERERHVSKAHHKANKNAQITIDRVKVLKVEKHLLPDDAQWKGYEDVIMQDVEFRTLNIRFRHPKSITRRAKKRRMWRRSPLATAVSSAQESKHGSAIACGRTKI